MLECLFAFLGAVVGGFIGLITAKRTIYNDSVSQRRNVWLNEMREYISKMLAYKKVLDDSKQNQNQNQTPSADIEKYIAEYEIAKNQVLIRLNMTEEKHMLLKKAIEDLDFGARDYDDVAPKLVEIARSILKEEWEKVKRETKGGK